MLTLRTILPLALALAIANPGAAMHCDTYSTSEPEYSTDNPTGLAVHYVDFDFGFRGIWSVWVYEESNGIPGLQREDEVVDDTCHGMIRGDTIVF